MFTLAITILTVLVLAGLAVLIAEHLPFGRETYTLSTRELPNIAADIGTSGRNSARR
jgi:hypothetical protein